MSGNIRNTHTISNTVVGGSGNVRKYLIILDKDKSVWTMLTKNGNEIYEGKWMAKKSELVYLDGHMEDRHVG